MSMPPVSLPHLRKPINLSPLATMFALIFSLAFGTACVSGISLSKGGNIRSAELLLGSALIVGAVSAAGLGAIAVCVVIRSRRSRQ